MASAEEFIRQHEHDYKIKLMDVEAAPGTRVMAFQVTDFVDLCAEDVARLIDAVSRKWPHPSQGPSPAPRSSRESEPQRRGGDEPG